jgi:hypothetical protein
MAIYLLTNYLLLKKQKNESSKYSTEIERGGYPKGTPYD